MGFRACGVGLYGFFGVGALYVNIEEKKQRKIFAVVTQV